MSSKGIQQCHHVSKLPVGAHEALKALRRGEADEYQQQLCLKIIVDHFARSHDSTYIPGSFDQSAFIAGRAFVGQQILKYLNLPVGKLKKEEHNDEHS